MRFFVLFKRNIGGTGLIKYFEEYSCIGKIQGGLKMTIVDEKTETLTFIDLNNLV